MTGNTIFLGIDVANGKWAAGSFHCSILIIFLVGVTTAQALGRIGIPSVGNTHGNGGAARCVGFPG